jgi:hypothetical protein
MVTVAVDDVTARTGGDPRTPTLPDRESFDAAMVSDDVAGRVDHDALARFGACADEPRALATSDEAHVHALGLGRRPQAEGRGHGTHIGLGERAHREARS